MYIHTHTHLSLKIYKACSFDTRSPRGSLEAEGFAQRSLARWLKALGSPSLGGLEAAKESVAEAVRRLFF